MGNRAEASESKDRWLLPSGNQNDGNEVPRHKNKQEGLIIQES